MNDNNKEMILISRKDLKTMIEEILGENSSPQELEWVTEPEAMKRLGIKSKSHLWGLRTKGLLEFSQPSRKIILYSVHSISQYIQSHVHKAF